MKVPFVGGPLDGEVREFVKCPIIVEIPDVGTYGLVRMIKGGLYFSHYVYVPMLYRLKGNWIAW